MIVVDTNVIAALVLNGPMTGAAERLLAEDDQWQAPLLWRSELRNVLATQMRVKAITLEQAQQIQREAQDLMAHGEHEVDSEHVLALAGQSGCTAYDCEFVEVALRLGTRLHTRDQKLVKAFPKTAKLFAPN